jgi:hypothetical protein
MAIISFIGIYLFLLSSIIGYGYFFSNNISTYNKDVNIGYIGIYGIFFLTLISYLTNLIIPHNFIHNYIIIFFGFFFFLKYTFKVKRIKKDFDIKILLFFIIISLFAVLYFKNHDDFPYYHLSFIHNITLNKVEFGLGNFDLAYNHVSSLFFFHSLFRLPFTGDYFYFIGPVSVLIFVNVILIKSIYQIDKNKRLNFINFLSLFIFIFINVFFYRLAEHGTDRSAIILIFLIIILMFQIFESKVLDRMKFENFIILLTLVVSIKSFYAIYAFLFFIIYFKFFSLKKITVFFNEYKIIYLSFIFCLLIFFYNIAYTGCLVYPVTSTCFENAFWAMDMSRIETAMNWYELWSKSGANPNYRVDNPDYYIQGFNWVQNWIDNYFFNKVSDSILGLMTIIIISFILFKPKKIIFRYPKVLNLIFIALFIYFFEWFYNHPSLRYGGYHLLALTFFIPTAIFFSGQDFKFANYQKKIHLLIIISIIIFTSRNIDRINNEVEGYNYDFIQSPTYRIQPDFYKLKKSKKEVFSKTDNCKIEIEKNKNCKIIRGYTFFYKKNF